jgi:hypothetical protein
MKVSIEFMKRSIRPRRHFPNHAGLDIAERVFACGESLSDREIFETLITPADGISYSTVTRTLNLLVDVGMLRCEGDRQIIESLD